VESVAGRRTADRRRQIAEQTLELRGLRGKSSAKVRLMLERVDAETHEFEQCTTRLQALRAVHTRMLKDLMIGLSSDAVRDEVDRMQRDSGSSWLKLGAKKAFVALFQRLRANLTQAGDRSAEIEQMLSAQFQRLNSDFGFSLALARGPDFERFQHDLELIEGSYIRYFTLTYALKLTERHFMEQFRRMLISKLRVVFETANGEVEMWNKAASSQIDAQLRDRRHDFRRRHDALERIQSAAGDLEQRLAELEAQDQRLQQEAARCSELLDAVRAQAKAGAALKPIDATPTLKQA